MWRTSMAAVLGSLALAACGSSQTSTTRSSTAPASTGKRAVGRCLHLKTGYVSTEGATGHLEVTFSLRNVSRHRCRIQGYPAATLLGPSGRALPMRVRRGHGFFPDTMRPARSVLLAPGARARFGVSFVTNNEYAGARTCRTAVSAVAGMSGWHTPISLRRPPKISPCGTQLVVSPVYT